jgi:transmembrane sensor
MIHNYDKEKIERFINGKSDESEAQFIYSLFSENENNLEFEHQIRNDFYEFIKNTQDKNYNLSYLLDRIHHTIHKNEGRKKQTIVKKIYQWYSFAAAVLLIPLIIAGGIWVFEKNDEKTIVAENPVTSTLFAPLGSRISFSLPDGTTGWLNSGSSIEYNIPFINKSRNVSLHGEAWFDVATDENHPFEITAGNSKVKVLGTKFNMSAYPEEKYMEVVLENGKVEFSAFGIGKSIQMKPNERLIYTSNSVNISLTETSKYSAWKEGKLIFRGDPMTEVVRRIERWYNVEVELVDKELENYVIRGTFQDDSLEDVIKYLSLTSPVRYRIFDREVLKDGTLQKKKVLIYKRNN